MKVKKKAISIHNSKVWNLRSKCIHAHLHIYVYKLVPAYIHTYQHVYIHACIYKCKYIDIDIDIDAVRWNGKVKLTANRITVYA